jgi:hypothetical protein
VTYAGLPEIVSQLFESNASRFGTRLNIEIFKKILVETRRDLIELNLPRELKTKIRKNIDLLLRSSSFDVEDWGYLDRELQSEILASIKKGLSQASTEGGLSTTKHLLENGFPSMDQVLAYSEIHERVRNAIELPFGYQEKAPQLTEINPRFRPFLYIVQMQHRPKPILLLGTEHSMPLKVFPPSVRNIDKVTDVLVEEMKMVEGPTRMLGDLSWLTLQELEELGLYSQNGFNWVSQLPMIQSVQMKATLGKLIKSIWSVSLDQIHPVVVEFVLNKELFRYLSGNGIDQEIRLKFQFSNKPIYALETSKDRVVAYEILKRLISEKQDFNDSCLVRLVDAFDLMKKTFDKDVDNHYRSRDSMVSYANGDLGLFRKTAENPALQIRNLIWRERILEIVDQNPHKTILFMIGVGHLPSNTGLLKFFLDLGAKVTRVGDTNLNEMDLDQLKIKFENLGL